MTISHPDEPQKLRCDLPEPMANRWLVFEADFAQAGLVDVLVEVHFADGTRTFLRPALLARNVFDTAIRAQLPITGATIHAVGSGEAARPIRLRFGPDKLASQTLRVVWHAIRLALTSPTRLYRSGIWFLERMLRTNAIYLPSRRVVPAGADPYARWIDVFDERPEEDASVHVERLRRLTTRRKISVLLPVPSVDAAEAAARALSAQIYPDWEVVAAIAQKPADRSAVPLARNLKVVFCASASRAAALNAALACATGEVVIAPPAGARLRPHALLEAALCFAQRPDTTALYADEDFLGPDGSRTAPAFKAAWAPHAAVAKDIMGDPTFYATDAVRAAGGWREEMAGAEDHDLKLRLAEAARPQTLVHLAKILLHRTEPKADDGTSRGAVARAAKAHLQRIGVDADVVLEAPSSFPRIRRRVKGDPLVSIIIPTRDRAALLGMCVSSILERTRYRNLELIVVDNDSREPATVKLFRELEGDARIRIHPHPGPFNYSALNNAAVRQARGSVLALLNNDIEVISEDWLEEMVSYACDPQVGCVGAKLLYPDGTLQHGSVVVGIGGGAGHVHKHAARSDPGYLHRLVTVQNASALTAACLVVRKSVYQEVGGLDEESFRVAFNDVDFCLKVASAGYYNVWTPFAELLHHESVSRGNDLQDRGKARRMASELAALQGKWGLRLLFDPYYPPHLEWQTEQGRIRTY